MNRLRYTLVALAACIAVTVQAQLKLTANAPGEVDINVPYFQLSYTIASASATDFEVKGMDDFDILSGPSTSVSRSMSSINGKMTSSSSCTFTYILAPRKQGKYTIPAATVKVDGRTYRSLPVNIAVTGDGTRREPSAGGQASSGGQAPQLQRAGTAVTEKDLYVSADIGRKEVYEQEAIPVAYRFYARPGVGLNTIGLSQKPDFKGFVSQEIPVNNIDADIARVDGQTYRTGVVQQYLLFPQQAGTLLLPGMVFNCVVIQRDAAMDPLDAFFNGGGNIGVNLKRRVGEVQLVVKPLPVPKPAGFTGGVGQFKVTGSLLTPDVRTNDMITYRLTVAGTGNLKLITPPALAFPADFDTYTPKTVDKTEVTAAGVSGSVSFDYTFVPRNIGQYELPEMPFVYFDPAKGSYETIVIPALKLEVKKGHRSDAELEREQVLRESDIRPVAEGGIASLSSPSSYYWWATWRYWAVCVLLLVIAVVGERIIRHRLDIASDTVRSKQNKAAKMAARRLKAAKALLDKGDRTAFYTELSRALTAYLSDKLNLPVADLSRERISEELVFAGVEKTLVDGFTALLEECEFVRFAPSAASGQSGELYDRAVQLIAGIDRSFKK